MPPRQQSCESSVTVIITCEHGGNSVPAEWRRLFRNGSAVLKSHRGWDPGALPLAEFLADELRAPLFSSTTTRLLVELNRSLHHRSLFSEFTRPLPNDDKQQLINDHWRPHRESVTEQISSVVASGGTVVHFSVHSFTPVLKGEERRTDIGLLFDPSRSSETVVCRALQRSLQTTLPNLKVHRNQPYRGTADGFTSHLRQHFPANSYVGIELEVKHTLLLRNSPQRRLIFRQLSDQTAAAAGTLSSD